MRVTEARAQWQRAREPQAQRLSARESAFKGESDRRRSRCLIELHLCGIGMRNKHPRSDFRRQFLAITNNTFITIAIDNEVMFCGLVQQSFSPLLCTVLLYWN